VTDTNIFCEALEEKNRLKLLQIPKSDLHNHSSKGCRREWLEGQLKRNLPKSPDKFEGIEGMHEWFTSSVKPYCKGKEGLIMRWEGAFAEAKRNNIVRLSMNFGAQDIELVGGMEAYGRIIGNFHRMYCPNTSFEPELTYPSSCDILQEAERIEAYISTGFFNSIDVCGGENVRAFEEYLPLYRKAEKYHLTKRMHVGETGSAEDVMRAVEVLGLEEIHHGINAAQSDTVMRFLADNHIQLNICPSSNVMLGYAKTYKDHPIRILYENGVKVTINTEDLLLFDSSIENEYSMLYKSGALLAEKLDEIRRNGLS